MGGSPTQAMKDYKRHGMEMPPQRVGYGVGGEMLFAPPETAKSNNPQNSVSRDTSSSEYQKAAMADKAAQSQKEYAPRD